MTTGDVKIPKWALSVLGAFFLLVTVLAGAWANSINSWAQKIDGNQVGVIVDVAALKQAKGDQGGRLVRMESKIDHMMELLVEEKNRRD